MVYFVGGIGVTTALAMCRHEAASGGTRRLVVDYSVRERRDAILPRGAARVCRQSTCAVSAACDNRDRTHDCGEVRRIAEDNPNATFGRLRPYGIR